VKGEIAQHWGPMFQGDKPTTLTVGLRNWDRQRQLLAAHGYRLTSMPSARSQAV
jgi:hypothetical protein